MTRVGRPLGLDWPLLIPGDDSSGLLARYSFDESEGQHVFDSSGNGWHGEIVGPREGRDGMFGGALAVGEATTVEFGDVCDFDRTESFTISAWILIPTAETGIALFHKAPPTPPFRGFKIQYMRNGGLCLQLTQSYPEKILWVATSERFPVGEWAHFAVTYDGSSTVSGVKFYVNGRESAGRNERSRSSLDRSIRNVDSFRIGVPGKPRPTVVFDELRIYARVLSPIEVRHNFDANPPTSPADR